MDDLDWVSMLFMGILVLPALLIFGPIFLPLSFFKWLLGFGFYW